jgi:hypothetical protein
VKHGTVDNWRAPTASQAWQETPEVSFVRDEFRWVCLVTGEFVNHQQRERRVLLLRPRKRPRHCGEELIAQQSYLQVPIAVSITPVLSPSPLLPLHSPTSHIPPARSHGDEPSPTFEQPPAFIGHLEEDYGDDAGVIEMLFARVLLLSIASGIVSSPSLFAKM